MSHHCSDHWCWPSWEENPSYSAHWQSSAGYYWSDSNCTGCPEPCSGSEDIRWCQRFPEPSREGESFFQHADSSLQEGSKGLPTLSRNFSKAKECIKKVSKKCGIKDTLVEIQRYFIVFCSSSLLICLVRANLDAINFCAHQELTHLLSFIWICWSQLQYNWIISF